MAGRIQQPKTAPRLRPSGVLVSIEARSEDGRVAKIAFNGQRWAWGVGKEADDSAFASGVADRPGQALEEALNRLGLIEEGR